MIMKLQTALLGAMDSSGSEPRPLIVIQTRHQPSGSIRDGEILDQLTAYCSSRRSLLHRVGLSLKYCVRDLLSSRAVLSFYQFNPLLVSEIMFHLQFAVTFFFSISLSPAILVVHFVRRVRDVSFM
jgi:hypothetical protein